MSNHIPTLSAIAALSENRVIGLNNQMPWHLPADLKHFRTITSGHPILMGRKTFESIGRPLPNRTNIILTRDTHYQAEGCIVINNPDDALTLVNNINQSEIFIIGGAEIYQLLLPKVTRLYLTEIHHQFQGDTFFPELDKTAWREVSRETHAADELNAYTYSFIVLERI